MQCFLTGATGYIGSAVLDAMIKGGHRVTALARDPEKAERLQAKGATTIIGELGLPKTYVAAVKAADAVVHTALESSPRGVAEGEAGARHHARRAGRGEPGRRQAARRSSTRPACGCWAAASRRPKRMRRSIRRRTSSGGRLTKSMVLSAFSASLRTVVVRPGIVYGGGRGIVVRPDQGRAERPDPRRRARQEPLAVHLRSRPRRALREHSRIADGRGRHPRHRRGRRARRSTSSKRSPRRCRRSPTSASCR